MPQSVPPPPSQPAVPPRQPQPTLTSQNQAPPESTAGSVEYIDLTEEEAAPAEYDIHSTSVETWLRSLQVRSTLIIRWPSPGVGVSEAQREGRHQPDASRCDVASPQRIVA